MGDKTEIAILQKEKDEIADSLIESRRTIDQLKEVAEEVLLWASTSQEHGGNPYCKKFVQLAQKALATWTPEQALFTPTKKYNYDPKA